MGRAHQEGVAREDITEYLDDEPEPIAPDGGWGWLVVLSSFFIAVVVDGVCFAFGIFYLEYLDYFKESNSKTAWIGSVLNGTYMITGPLAAALANKFGCKAVTIVGSLWSTAALLASSFSTNVNILILTHGVLGGIGFGLMYLPSIVIVGFYFDKKRALTTGIATCGSGIGGFIFAPLSRRLIEAYGWKGAQWILAGIALNVAALGMLYRPITDRDMNKIRTKWRVKKLATLKTKQNNNDMTVKYTDTQSSDRFANGQIVDHSMEIPDDGEEEGNRSFLIVKDKPRCHPDLDKPFYSISSLDKTQILDSSHCPSSMMYSTRSLASSLGSHHSNNLVHSAQLFGDSIHSLSSYIHSRDNIQKSALPKIEEGTTTNSATSGGFCGVFKEILGHVRESMDVSMLLNPVFVLYGFSCILCMYGFFIPFIYLPDYVLHLGHGVEEGATLLSILGITNTVGRVLAGWISDRPWADCLVINNVSLVIGGVATSLVPFITNYIVLCVYCAVFGFCIAAFVSLRSIILVDLIGLQKLTSAFGLIVLCQGITSFVGAPIAGFLKDATGDYNMSFYIAGSTVALAGVVSFPLRKLARYLDKRRDVKMNNSVEYYVGSEEDLPPAGTRIYKGNLKPKTPLQEDT